MTTLEREQARPIVESADSPLGRWIAAHWSPPSPSPLAGIVERIWYFDGTLAQPKERVFPDGSAELVVMLDDVHRDGDADPAAPFPAVCINGLRTRPSVVVAPAAGCRVLGVRLSPLGACALLRESIRDLLDVTIDLHAALGRAAEELAESCCDAADTSVWNPERNAVAVLAATKRWLGRSLSSGSPFDPSVQYAMREIAAARGAISVDRIVSDLGIPRSRLAQRFRNSVGVTPKRLARIVRFHAALRAIGTLDSLTEAAGDLAYYDQAHMHRDFLEFAGMTPGAFLSATRYPGGANLAEA